jgi:hypothetical protein
MKVGDYVRTPQGIIAKIVNIQEDTGQYFLNGNAVSLESKNYIADKNITIGENFKHSPNIIDLIEENDLIEIEYKISTGENQKEIVQVIKNANNKLFIKTYTEHYVFIEDIEKTIYKIKGIITHEQIESMKYKVKE